MTNIEINMLRYVDNSAIILNSRSNIITASRIVCDFMKKQRVTAYVEYNERQSKTNLILFLSTRILARQRSDAKSINNNNNSITEELEVQKN